MRENSSSLEAGRAQLSRRGLVKSVATGVLGGSFAVRATSLLAQPAAETAYAAGELLQAETQQQIDFLNRSFVLGREYFVLRSGRIQVIVQSDRLDTVSAVLWLAFDARDSKQNASKANAYNFAGGAGFLRSTLQVELGDFLFTPLGHETRVRWTQVDGVPAIEAQWWAGGILVTELFFAQGESGCFLRRIVLESRNMGGSEAVALVLKLPSGIATEKNGWLTTSDARSHIAITTDAASHLDSGELRIELAGLLPGQRVSYDTWMVLALVPDELILPSPSELVQFHVASQRQWLRCSSISTPDSLVQGLFDRARFSLNGMIGDDGTMDAGIFEYGGQWVRDTSNTIVGLLHAGHFELAGTALRQVFARMISDDGRTMISGQFDEPEREEFDEMGELLHALRCYVDWTGDATLIRDMRSKILAVIERPLAPQFRHASGLIQGRREYWERTTDFGLESVYQFYVVLGLRCAISLAPLFGAEANIPRWQAEEQRMLQVILHAPRWSMIQDGRIVKRKALDGIVTREIASYVAAPDVPMKTERIHLAEPDAGCALPIALGLVDPKGPVAQTTLDFLEGLWSARWFGGGYERYHSSAQPDQPGPWPFATCFLLRAQHDAGMYDRSRRTLAWMDSVQGGNSGAWFEEIPLIRSQAPHAGILPWTSAEITLFTVRHLLGVHFEGGQMVLRPNLYPGSGPVRATLRYRSATMELHLPGAGRARYAMIGERRVQAGSDGSVVVPKDFSGGKITVFL